jgi:hypothetical protein
MARSAQENNSVPHLRRSDFSCSLPRETDAAVFCVNIATARHGSIVYKKEKSCTFKKIPTNVTKWWSAAEEHGFSRALSDSIK